MATETDSSAKNTTYLITGANRGMGRGYVETFLARANTTVIATVRGPSHPSSTSLSSLPTGPGSALHVIKLDHTLPSDPSAAIDQLPALGIDSIDVVIANAGVTGSSARVEHVPLEEILSVVQINTLSNVLLFQALTAKGLLKKGAKVALVGSAMGSIEGIDQRPFADASYGLSKVGLHWLSRKIHQEHEDLVVFNLDPGFAQTDMGNAGAQKFGLGKAWFPVEDAVAGCVDKIDKATRETHGGKYVTWDGSDFPW